MPNHITEPETATAVRTLLAAGFTIARAHRQPAHIEIKCSRVDVLGANIPYLICISERDEFMSEQLKDLARTANSEGRVLVVLAGQPGNG